MPRSPRTVVITDDEVVIDQTTVAAKLPKADFQIFLGQVRRALGKPSSVFNNWGTASYCWNKDGITLGVSGEHMRCDFLRFNLRVKENSGSNVANRPFRGKIWIDGLAISAETSPESLLRIGFKRRDGDLVRSFRKHTIVFRLPGNVVQTVSIELPGAHSAEWTIID